MPSFDPPPLKFFNEFAEIGKARNRLPHWSQTAAAYFVTYRLGDSIPDALMKSWREERDHWCREHPKPWSMETESDYHRRFSSAMDRNLDDGHGSCLLRDLENAGIVAGAFNHYDHRHYLLHAWVIMPNHVHVLVSPGGDDSLSRIVAGWKRFTGTGINARTGKSATFWQKDYFDRLIRDWDHFLNVARYIRRNPEKAGLREREFMVYEAPWVKSLLS